MVIVKTHELFISIKRTRARYDFLFKSLQIKGESKNTVQNICFDFHISQKSFSFLFLQITKKSESFKYNTIHWLNTRWVTHCVIAKMHSLPQFNKSGI